MSNPANLRGCQKEDNVLEITIWERKNGIDAVIETLADQLADSVDATLVEPRGNMAVYR